MAIQFSPVTRQSKNRKMSVQQIQHSVPEYIQSMKLEQLPTELLRKIFFYVTCHANKARSQVAMPGCINTAKQIEHLSLLSVLCTSRRLYDVAITSAYRSPVVTSTLSLGKLIQQVVKHPELGRLIRKLDLSSVTETRNLCLQATYANPLGALLSRTPLLREFSVNKTLTRYVDHGVFSLLLCELPHLKTLNLDLCSSSTLNSACDIIGRKSCSTSITSLSLQKCDSLIDQPYQLLLSSLPGLRSLNLSHTWITIEALMSIPQTARIQHLDISFCDNLNGSDIAKFLSSHPAVTKSLISLTVAQNEGESFLYPEDVTVILDGLPTTMTHLDLHHAAVAPEHITQLKQLRSLEYFAPGSTMKISSLEQMILTPGYKYPLSTNEEEHTRFTDVQSKQTPVLGPLSVAIHVCKFRRRLNSTTHHANTTQRSKLRHLNISTMMASEQVKIIDSVILGPFTMELQVIELSSLAMNWQEGLIGEVAKGAGWVARNVGRRYWLQRV